MLRVVLRLDRFDGAQGFDRVRQQSLYVAGDFDLPEIFKKT